MDNVSVIIPTRNKAKTIRSGLASILKNDPKDVEYEVIVVDNGSTDGTQNVLAQMAASYPQMRWVIETTPGASAARNRGILESKGDLLLFLDDDIVVKSDHIAFHIAQHHLQSDLCFIVCTQNHTTSNDPPLALYLASVDEVGARVPASGQERVGLVSQDFSIRRESMELVRFERFGRVQFFDEEFLLCEDSDLGLRLHKQGIRFNFASDVFAMHIHSYTRQQYAERSRKAGYYERRLLIRHPDMPFGKERVRSTLVRSLARIAGAAGMTVGSFFGKRLDSLTIASVGLWSKAYRRSGYYQAKSEERSGST